MRQFDVYRLRDGRNKLVIILQNDVVDDLDTRVVAPLSDEPYKRLIARVRIPLEFDRTPFVLLLDRLAAIDKRALGSFLGNIRHEEYRIKTALDLLFLGV